MLIPPRVSLAPSSSSPALFKSSSGLPQNSFDVSAPSCSSPGPARRSLERGGSETLFKPISGFLQNGLDGCSSPGPARRAIERLAPAVFLHSGQDGSAPSCSSPGPARRSLDRVGAETLLKSPIGFPQVDGSAGATRKPNKPVCAASENDSDIRSLQIQVAALYAQLQALSSKCEALSSKFDGIGPGLVQTSNEMPKYSDQFGADEEERLATRVMKAIEKSMRALGQHGKDSPHSQPALGAFASPSGECSSPEDEPQRNACLVNAIADQVIARVNADPRICQLVESHQSLQESFSKLLGLMDKENLEEMVLDTRKTCKAIAVEMRQLRQRRNQDVSDNWIRFDDLERKLQIIEGGSNGRIEGLDASSCVKRQFFESHEQKRTIDAAAIFQELVPDQRA